MSNRIGGDFDPDIIEAFRSAYAAQLSTPEDQDVDINYNLPTEVLSNTSPWVEHTGLWKYPSGKGPESDLKQPFNPNDFITSEEEETEEDDFLTPEEVEEIIQQIFDEEDEEEQPDTVGEAYEEEEASEEEGLTEDEIDALINEILSSDEED